MKVINHLKNGIEYATYTATHSEPLEKFAKVVYRLIDAANRIFGTIAAPFLNLSSQLKEACTVFESVKVFGNIKMLFIPGKNGKYFLNDPNNSWQKRADRVTLLCHNTFKFVKGLNKFGFVQLGVLAKNIIGKLPIFTFAMDSFIISSSFFSTWDSVAYGLPNARRLSSTAQEKLVKWEFRRTAIEFLKTEDAIECKAFATRYKEKAARLETRLNMLKVQQISNEAKKVELLAALEAALAECPPKTKASLEKQLEAIDSKSKELASGIKKLEGSQEKVAGRLELIENKDWKGLAAVLEESAEQRVQIINAGWQANAADNKIANVDYKIKKWEAHKENAKIETNKTWLRIANAVGKIAIVALAMAVTVADFWFFVPAALAVDFLGTAVDSIGWTKLLTDEYYKSVKLPQAVAV